MSKKFFTRPMVDVIHFKEEVIATSSCGSYDPDYCPVNYNNCTNDGARCECTINYNPQKDNCTICTAN